jgi:Cyclic nucleotide-binding domain
MLSRAPERRMRGVRLVFLLGWMVIILSLLYDPLTPELTSADNLASPFRLSANPTIVQGAPVPADPYPVTARILWSIIVPVFPIALMLFGHETWRRICPLSFVNQIPHMLDWQRRVKTVNRSAGRVDRMLALMPSESWIRRNHYHVQFWLLALGVLGRILFYDSDRDALAFALVATMACAFAIGLLYGGKTWCNYFCPLAVVQAAYTGPGGLLDSKAHIAPAPTGQSMCRTRSVNGDRSACVGCTTNCPDVDLENSYWKRLDSDSKRFMYYGLFGLNVAFFTYFYAYSGNWGYYMSGAWTHERSQWATLLAPGFYFGGHAVAIPKIIAAPLYFLSWIFAAYGVLFLVERVWSRASTLAGKPMSPAQLRHRMLTISGFLSITVFYLFAGRPGFLPGWAIELIDLAIAAISITWLIRSLSRDADTYRREHLGKTLRQQLVRMGFRSEDVLEGRPLEQLTADEIYVLAKTLPNFSMAQKREAYRGILVDALETGHTRSVDCLSTLRDVREQLGLSDADHAAIAQAIGIQDPSLFDTDVARSIESRLRRDNYRNFLLDLAQQGLASGASPSSCLESPSARSAIARLRAFFGISEEEHGRVIAEVTHDDARFVDNARKLLEAFREMEVYRFSLAADKRPEGRIARHALLLRQRLLIHEIVNVVACLTHPQFARSIAQSTYALAGRQTEEALLEAIASLPSEVRSAFQSSTTDPVYLSYSDVVEAAKPADDVLRTLADDHDPIVAALAISGLVADSAHASVLVEELWPRDAASSAFLDDVRAQAMRGRRAEAVVAMGELLNVEAFAALDLSLLASIAEQSELRHYSEGECICRLGEESDSMFVLVEGQTEAWVESDGRKVILGHGQKGSLFGELGVITRRARSTTVEVRSATASAVIVPRQIVDDLLHRDLHATRAILNVVSGYLLDTIFTTAHQTPQLAKAAAPVR